MSLDIRMKVNEDRKQKLIDIDGAVDADKTTIRLRLMNDAIDSFHAKLFNTGQVVETMLSGKNE